MRSSSTSGKQRRSPWTWRWPACLELNLGTPTTYAVAFLRLAAGGVLEGDLAKRLVPAAGFRNVVAHMYERLDMTRVHRAAGRGPDELRAFLRALREHVSPQPPEFGAGGSQPDPR